MIVEFSGNFDSNVMYAWEGVTGFEVMPLRWRDYYMYYTRDICWDCDILDISDLKNLMIKDLKDRDIDVENIETCKTLMLERIAEDLLSGGNINIISAANYILDMIWEEKDFELSLVKLKFDTYGDMREEQWIIVANDSFKISDVNGRVLLMME